MCLSIQNSRYKYAYKFTASSCLSTDCKRGICRPLLLVFNSGIYPGFHSFLLYKFNNYTGDYAVLIINTHHKKDALNDADNEMNYAALYTTDSHT